MDKSKAQLERDINSILSSGSGAYYPGGSGGGGRQATGRLGAGAVIKPHPRSRPTCIKCGRFHTIEEHALHGGRANANAKKAKSKKAKAGTKTAKTKRSKAKAKTKVGKRTRAKSKTRRARKTKKTKRAKKARSARRKRADPAALARKTERIAARIRDTLPIVLSAVRSMPPSGRFGPGDVFISAAYDKVGKRIGMTMDQFKHWLIVQNRMQNLSLHRADMVDAMDPRKVDRSEINDLGAQFHFIRDRDA